MSEYRYVGDKLKTRHKQKYHPLRGEVVAQEARFAILDEIKWPIENRIVDLGKARTASLHEYK